jgi:hypothetical protein
LHACAKDGCYMCDDKAHRQCFDCGRNVAVALWCYDNPEDTPALVVKGHGGTKLTTVSVSEDTESCGSQQGRSMVAARAGHAGSHRLPL